MDRMWFRYCGMGAMQGISPYGEHGGVEAEDLQVECGEPLSTDDQTELTWRGTVRGSWGQGVRWVMRS